MSIEQLIKDAEQRRQLYPPIRQLTGSDDFLVINLDVLRWMGQPDAHFIECKQFFEEFPDFARNLSPFVLFDFHQFLKICQLHSVDCLNRFLEHLNDTSLIIGTFHNELEIAQACSKEIKSCNFEPALELLGGPKLTAGKIVDLVELSKASSALKPILAKLISVYRLHDPDENQLSSFLTRMGRIKTSRILYLLIPHPECWPDLEYALSADTEEEISSSWHRLSTSGPMNLGTNFCWHIQATVLRIIMLALAFQGQSAKLELWKQFLAQNGFGHDGDSRGFHRDTLKTLDALEKNKKWITIRYN